MSKQSKPSWGTFLYPMWHHKGSICRYLEHFQKIGSIRPRRKKGKIFLHFPFSKMFPDCLETHTSLLFYLNMGPCHTRKLLVALVSHTCLTQATWISSCEFFFFNGSLKKHHLQINYFFSSVCASVSKVSLVSLWGCCTDIDWLSFVQLCHGTCCVFQMQRTWMSLIPMQVHYYYFLMNIMPKICSTLIIQLYFELL